MEEDFELPVTYKNKELALPARFLRSGYSYKIQVQVNDQLLLFEPDEERNWRALVDPNEMEKSKIDRELMQCIVDSLDEVLK
jgi:hypothetical protein